MQAVKLAFIKMKESKNNKELHKNIKLYESTLKKYNQIVQKERIEAAQERQKKQDIYMLEQLIALRNTIKSLSEKELVKYLKTKGLNESSSKTSGDLIDMCSTIASMRYYQE